MAFALRDLYSWHGEIDRGPYLKLGLILFLIKYNLDRLVSGHFFGRSWYPISYLLPSEVPELLAFQEKDRVFFLTLAAIALPFIWSGVMLTIRRLHSLQAPELLLLLFFVPYLNFVFFLVLSLLPAPAKGSSADFGVTPPRQDSFLARVIPVNPLGSAAFGVFTTTLAGLFLALFSISWLERYGWGLFVGIPFCAGLIAAHLHCFHARRNFGECLSVALGSVALMGVMLFVLAFEGIICILMAAPLALILGALGGLLAYFLQIPIYGRNQQAHMAVCLPLALLAAMTFETQQLPKPQVFKVNSAVEIRAPINKVWRHVVSFSQIPEPQEWIFKTGIAYPVRARIEGQGVGAVRHCEFSTGAFVEPIEVWQPPYHLKFSVSSSPPPMEEWSIYSGINAPHLQGFFSSKMGEFRLSETKPGIVLLEGNTWYEHSIWPAFYWRFWSDAVIRRIHLRVLRHIEVLAEG